MNENQMDKKVADFLTEQLGEPIADAEAFGKQMAVGFRWNGSLILLAAATALEQANFHDYAATVNEWLDEMEECYYEQLDIEELNRKAKD